MKTVGRKPIFAAVSAAAAILLACLPVCSAAVSAAGGILAETGADNGARTDVEYSADPSAIGGGYAATGQIDNVGYTTQIYDASNGLPTSDANFILGASNGYIWIGGYSGIIRYDGSSFTKMDASAGLTNGSGLFEDSRGRIWVGTNDNGVVVIDGSKTTRITYKQGLPSSSIRVFAEDADGNIFIGTTAGVCYADPDMHIHTIDDSRLNKERVLRLDADSSGMIYGQTKNGLIFTIDHCLIGTVLSGQKLGIGQITSILADPDHEGKVYIGTATDVLYYGSFGDDINALECIITRPLYGVQWMSYDCGRVWLASPDVAGYLDENMSFNVLDSIPMNSGIEMMTSDYQGNMWFASSTQGVMKLVANCFVDLYDKADLSPAVTNAVCKYMYNADLYAGTDHGLRIIGVNEDSVVNKLVGHMGNSKVSCIINGSDNDLWIGASSNGRGLVHMSADGSISDFNRSNGLPDDEIRSIALARDKTVIAGTNGGLAFIKDDKVQRTLTSEDGLRNTVILTVADGDNGDIYAGTDGGGIYVINGDDIRRIGRDDGLTSDVIVRIKRDDVRNLYWIITSNSIEYMKGGIITEVTTFPYNNNYDIQLDGDTAWILSSYGLYEVRPDEMVADDISDYRLYTLANGMMSAPTSNSYNALDENGNLYIAGRTGVFRVNRSFFSDERIPIKAAISSVFYGDEQILPDASGTFPLPSSDGRLRISASVLDYTLSDPTVSVYMDNEKGDGTTVPRSKLQPLEYTGLKYGNHILHVVVRDSTGKNVLLNKVFPIQKKAKFIEMPIVRFIMFLLVVLLTGFIVWRVIKTTIIRRQYDEIRQARDDAEKANSARSRFLTNMSDELRTPINTIMGMNEMALREDASGVPRNYSDQINTYSQDIRKAAESLLSMINDIIDMSKIETGKIQLAEREYDTQELLRSVTSMIRTRSAEKDLKFDINIDEILPARLYGDADKIRQIVLNLLTNALKYTEFGGFSLSVSMSERLDDECELCFSVKDTGIGIKEEDLDKLFTAYERLDEEQDSAILGTGLGLDISRIFAELMGGTLTCESVYGSGSEFKLTVRQKIVDPAPIGIFSEYDNNTANGQYVPQFIAPDADILVVDDTPVNLNIIKGLLKATGVFVTTASSGEECLEKIKETRFNVVLLDNMMPGMDGPETVARIRETDPDLPVYALTADTAGGEEFYRSKGFNGYLSKPIDGLALEKTIMRHLPEKMMDHPAAPGEAVHREDHS